MKPSKSRVFCNDCKRSKILFETEKKANRFISFNQEVIKKEKGYAPKRSYFCSFCCGWHTTSVEGEIGLSKHEKLFNQYFKNNTGIRQEEEERKSDYKTIVRNKIEYQFRNKIKNATKDGIISFLSKEWKKAKKQIRKLATSNDSNKKNGLKDSYIILEIIEKIKQEYGIVTINPHFQKRKSNKDEEWKQWFESRGYGNT